MKKTAGKSSPLLRAIAVVAATGFVLPMVLTAQETPLLNHAGNSTEMEQKRNFLFMGATLQIKYKGDLLPVTGIKGSSYEVLYKGKSILVQPNTASDLVLGRSFKLSDKAVRVEDLKIKQGYTTPGGKKLKREGLAMEKTSAEAGMQYAAEAIMMAANDTIAQRGGNVNTNADFLFPSLTLNLADTDTAYSAASSSFATSLVRGEQGPEDATDDAILLPDKPDPYSCDALGVSCKLSAPGLAKGFIVLVVKYATREAPEEEKAVFLTRELPVLGPKAFDLEISQSRFPRGFILKGSELHVYDQGRELSSNVALRQVALTDTDAHKLLVIDYVGRHKEETLVAKPIIKKYPASVRSRLAEPLFNRELFVKVSKEGSVAGVFSDEGCTQNAAPELDSLLVRWRFLPALEKGKPVDSVARVKPADTSL